MIYALLANGFEEVEAFAPIDILRRAGLTVKTVGIGGSEICGSHGICVKADILPEEATEKIDLLFLPGGMPGSSNLDASTDVDKLIARATADGAHIAAICAAPLVLGHRGLLAGKRAVCYPGFEGELQGAKIAEGRRVVTDGNITTAVGMGAACELGLTLVAILVSREAAEKIANSAFIDATCLITSAPTEEMPFDRLMLNALAVALEMGKLSTSLLQRKLYIGYGKAATILDALCEKGYVGEPNGAKPREVLITRQEFERLIAEFEEENE